MANFIPTSSDLQALSFVAKFGYCQDKHLAMLFNVNLMNITKLINRLVNAKCLERRRVLADVGPYLFLTHNAKSYVDTKLNTKVALHTLNHDTLLIDLYFYLNKLYSDRLIQSDKELRREAGIHKINTNLRLPDLLIDEQIAIELEISEKPQARLQNIINSYLVDDKIIQVNYYLFSAKLAQKIYQLTEQHNKFNFYLLSVDESEQLAVEDFNPSHVRYEYKSAATLKFGRYEF